ncbi:MAG: superinfection immunity protein [Phycisphaerae bacterium]|jgi:hypothetical protein
MLATFTFQLWMFPVAIVFLFIYFLPTYMAFRQKHPRIKTIFLLNFLLGATVVAWIILLVWALKAPR